MRLFTRSIIIAVLVGPASAFDQSSAQQTYYVGGGVSVGDLQSPYGGSCAGESGAAAGVGVIAGRSLGPVELSASFDHVKNVAIESVACATSPLWLPDGVHRRRTFDRGYNPGFNLVAFRMTYTPELLRYFGVYGGVGFETRDGDRAILTGARIRTAGAFRLNLGLDMVQFSTRYAQFDQTWEQGVVVSSEVVERGSTWRRYLAISIGLEIGLPQPAR